MRNATDSLFALQGIRPSYLGLLAVVSTPIAAIKRRVSQALSKYAAKTTTAERESGGKCVTLLRRIGED